MVEGVSFSDNWSRFKIEYERLIQEYHESVCSLMDIAVILKRHETPFVNEDGELFYLTAVQRSDLQIVLSHFNQFYIPRIVFERSLFFRRKQHLEESCEEYFMTLNIMSEFCNFGGYIDRYMIDAYISGLYDVTLRKTLLYIPDLTIEEALAVSRNWETLLVNSEENETDTKCNTFRSLFSCFKIKICFFSSKNIPNESKNVTGAIPEAVVKTKKSS